MAETKNRKIIETDDVVPTIEPWLRPKTEEIDDAKLIPAILQETVRLPHPIPKTDLPENIDYISAISDISRINNVSTDDDDDIDFNIVQQTPDSADDDVIYVKYILPPPEVPVQPPIHPREKLKRKMKKIRMKKERYRKNAKQKVIMFLNKKNAAKLLKEHKKTTKS